jgi:signal transduction histidine kinase
MGQELEIIGGQKDMMEFPPCLEEAKTESAERGLLLQAFEMFTQASSSLESAFSQLQERAQRLTEELEVKNRELERSLREKEEAQGYLKTILERLPCGVFALDSKGDLTLCNPMAWEVLEQSCGKPRGIVKDAQPFLNAEMRSRLSASAADEGGKAEVEISIQNSHNKRILATSGTPLTDASGNTIGTLHIIRDVTEVKALQEQSQRIERLSAMGEMAVELAHEIRNPLGSVELFASLLVKELSGDTRRWAENIRIGIRSLNTIVSNMLHFANPLSPAFCPVDLHHIIEEILRFADPIMSQRDVRVKTALAAENPQILADPELIKQMLLNLIFNAMKAMPSHGSLTISTSSVDIRGGERPSRGLQLQIQDTGIGIPPENLDRIFDPFFTTHKKGTGLGLSVVHQIVEKHSGCISVKSEVDRGTTFTIAFKNAPEKG